MINCLTDISIIKMSGSTFSVTAEYNGTDNYLKGEYVIINEYLIEFLTDGFLDSNLDLITNTDDIRDALLPYVESGVIKILGNYTYRPYAINKDG